MGKFKDYTQVSIRQLIQFQLAILPQLYCQGQNAPAFMAQKLVRRLVGLLFVPAVSTLLSEKFGRACVPSCPECVLRERKAILAKYADQEDVDVGPMLDAVEYPMKFDISTKHFICKRCGLYATREQVGDIRERINRKESTREDKQYDYLNWWQKSKKDK